MRSTKKPMLLISPAVRMLTFQELGGTYVTSVTGLITTVAEFMSAVIV